MRIPLLALMAGVMMDGGKTVVTFPFSALSAGVRWDARKDSDESRQWADVEDYSTAGEDEDDDPHDLRVLFF